MLKRILRIVLLLIVAAALAFGALLLYGTLTDYQPPESESLNTEAPAIPTAGSPGNTGDNASTAAASPAGTPVDSVLRLMIWNIGYAGLGRESDFFYDGGEMVRPSKALSGKNLDGIIETVKGLQDGSFLDPLAAAVQGADSAAVLNSQAHPLDFVLLQEVDRDAKRSWGADQARELAEALPDYSWNFAMNYRVNFIPIPFTEPMGRVSGGLVSFSRATPLAAERHQFPGNFAWPTRIYFLDRCFLVQRFAAPGGVELVLINTHNSAYDDGDLKRQQMDYLREFLLDEHEKGNYVIVGGDWNQCAPFFDPYTFGRDEEYTQLSIPAEYLPEEWRWLYDASVPTNRKVSEPLNDSTFTTIIDFFLISPRVEAMKVRGVDLGFEFSDHQPVLLEVRLR